MTGMKLKENELKKFAEIIQTSDSRREMLQKINGMRRGMLNGKIVNEKRVEALSILIAAYK